MTFRSANIASGVVDDNPAAQLSRRDSAVRCGRHDSHMSDVGAQIPPATIGVDPAGAPVQLGVEEFRGTDLCIVAGAAGSGTTNMLLLLASAWTAHMRVVIVGLGHYPETFTHIAPSQLPRFLVDHRAATRDPAAEVPETVLLLDHFLPADLEAGSPYDMPPALDWKPVPLNEVEFLDPTALDTPSLHVVMRWPRGEDSWMQLTDRWNVTASTVIALASTNSGTPFIDRRDGQPEQEFNPRKFIAL